MATARSGRWRELLLSAIAIILGLLALATLVPQPSAENSNGIGYRSYCPFAPASTLMLALPAGFAWAYRKPLD